MQPSSPSTYHQAVAAFKKHLILTTLESHRGNRTRTARALGLQRTYLIRLIQDFDIRVPATTPFARNANGE